MRVVYFFKHLTMHYQFIIIIVAIIGVGHNCRISASSLTTAYILQIEPKGNHNIKIGRSIRLTMSSTKFQARYSSLTLLTDNTLYIYVFNKTFQSHLLQPCTCLWIVSPPAPSFPQTSGAFRAPWRTPLYWCRVLYEAMHCSWMVSISQSIWATKGTGVWVRNSNYM